MSFACQKDSYCKQFTSIVKSCDPSQLSTVLNGKKQKLQGFDVILEDTILFPEGGGQPDDHGTIAGVPVLRVTRKGADAIHFLPTPLDPGSEVCIEVDWTRRWDHMQQHSAQHLVTAIADTQYGYPTTSWNLGEKTSFIELDTPSMSVDQMTALEALVNDKIRSCVPMYPTLFHSKDDPDLAKVRTRGLPDDHVGAVRVVTIEGVETNMCCGTHVSNLSHLQAIKLLCVEKGKKNKMNLVFVAGGRVLDYLGQAYDREKTLTSMLRGNPDQHAQLLEKLQKTFKVVNKNATTLLRDIAVLEAKIYREQSPRQPLLSIHRKEGDNEYMNMVVNEVNDKDAVVFMTTGDDRGQGMFLLAGPEGIIAELAPKVGECIEGKGATKRGRYQGKANRLSKRSEAEAVIRQFLSDKGTEDIV